MRFLKLSFSLIALMAFSLIACQQDDLAETPLSTDANANRSWTAGQPWTDTRDGQAYGTMLVAGKVWMTGNFNYAHPTEADYYGPGEKWLENEQLDDDHTVRSEEEQKALGRLYSWQAAQEVAPEGWRLPTSEEWEDLKQALGMVSDQKPPFEIRQEYYDFDIKSAGWMSTSLSYQDLGQMAGFWSASPVQDKVQYYHVKHRMLEMNEGKVSPRARLSVRYIKD